MLTLRLNNLGVILNHGSGTCVVLRDGQPLEFDVGDRAPLDVANDIKRSADELMLTGNITLMMLVCALMAANVPIMPHVLGIVHKASGSKFKSWTRFLTQAMAGDTAKLRLIVLQLVAPGTQLVINPVSRRARPTRGTVAGISA